VFLPLTPKGNIENEKRTNSDNRHKSGMVVRKFIPGMVLILYRGAVMIL